MTTEATFTVASDEFPLGTIFREYPDVTVELERIIPTDHTIIPYFWVHGRDIDDVATAFGPHPGVRKIELMADIDGQYLLRGEWTPDYEGILAGLVETEVTLLTGRGTASGWTFTVRGDTRKAVAAFQRYCQDHGIPIRISSIHELTPLHAPAYELTDTQQEALLLAFERGYFDSPREASLEELADKLDISHQAVASRLRRGTRRLIAGTLADTP